MYLNLKDAAQYTGDSTSTLRRAVVEGKLKGFKPRGRWKFRQTDLDEYIESGRIPEENFDLASLITDITEK